MSNNKTIMFVASPLSWDALNAAAEAERLSPTDIINRALQLYDALRTVDIGPVRDVKVVHHG